MGRKFKLGRHPKNGERRKGAIRLESFVVSLPLDLYDLCCSLDCLGQCLGKRDDLPTGLWNNCFPLCEHTYKSCCFFVGWSIEASSERLTLSQLDTSCSVPDVRCSLAATAWACQQQPDSRSILQECPGSQSSKCMCYKHQGQLSRKQRCRQSPASET